MAFKYLVVAMLVLILISLGKALFHLSSSKPGGDARMVKALAWRIGLSVALFVLLIVAYYNGWIISAARRARGPTANRRRMNSQAKPRRRSANTRRPLRSQNGASE